MRVSLESKTKSHKGREMNVIITGASRGIGLELTSQALAAKHQVIAVVRNLAKSPELKNLSEKFKEQLTVVEVDVSNPEAPAKVAAAANKWGSLDVLINNAGMYAKSDTAKDMLESFQVNTIAPYLMTKELLPILKKSKIPKVVHVTSKMGSIADNSSGGHYAYRSSKTALNMINKSLSCDFEWLTAIVIHPGWVKTDMGGQGATLEIKDSASGIWNVINKIKSPDSGAFYDFSGEEIPW